MFLILQMAKAPFRNLLKEVSLLLRPYKPRRKRLGYRKQFRTGWRTSLVLAATILVFQSAHAQAKRVVLLKVDGLPYPTVDRFVRERDPQTGKSRLPWFEHIFYQNGTRLTNFYVRGMSLSGPSWSLIDTGQHLQIKGNVEFDRYTFHTYDYLNF